MRTRNWFFRRVAGAVMVTAMALALGVPAMADDGDRPRDRGVDRDPVQRDSGSDRTRTPAIDPDGVEWTF